MQLHMLGSLTSTVSSFIREMHVQFKKKEKQCKHSDLYFVGKYSFIVCYYQMYSIYKYKGKYMCV